MINCIKRGKYVRYWSKGKYDDFLFWEFMKQKHGNAMVYNVVPNMVQHIDYIIGGSTINPHHNRMWRAAYWMEPEREEALKKAVAEWKESNMGGRNGERWR